MSIHKEMARCSSWPCTLWKAPSKILPPALQPASLQAKLPFLIKAEVLIQAQLLQESAELLFRLLVVLKGGKRWKKLLGGNLRALT